MELETAQAVAPAKAPDPCHFRPWFAHALSAVVFCSVFIWNSKGSELLVRLRGGVHKTQ
jgi:hypothetical protein